ncbi:C40 family peptidase [uncultured Thiodictyon sp.]|uniref:C40 family peptidase n=1 Tax=uncultured Thiodictyon sp. TaxID=1846217 RepID=UPI0025D63127|nr:C40 family peptidase [uncultured Thiodictyon sp.]
MKSVTRFLSSAGLVAAVLLLSGCAGLNSSQQVSGKRSEVVSAALSQVGTPYRYGANAPGRALDCSALTHYAYQQAGVPIPRMSVDQLRRARPVPLEALRPGDLVFFHTGPGVHHVGLMVDKNRFVHASTSQHKVGLTRLYAPYWTARYVGAGSYLD